MQICNIDWQVLTGASSVVIALCALIISILHGRTTRNHNKISVRPHLSGWSESDNTNSKFSADIINNGLGPALIKGSSVRVDGSLVTGKIEEQIKNAIDFVLPRTPGYQLKHAWLGNGYSMAAKEKIKVVEITFIASPFPEEEIEAMLNRIDLIIEYESFYGEKYRYSSKEEKKLELLITDGSGS